MPLSALLPVAAILEDSLSKKIFSAIKILFTARARLPATIRTVGRHFRDLTTANDTSRSSIPTSGRSAPCYQSWQFICKYLTLISWHMIKIFISYSPCRSTLLYSAFVRSFVKRDRYLQSAFTNVIVRTAQSAVLPPTLLR